MELHTQSVNQSITSSKRHTSTREATSQRNHGALHSLSSPLRHLHTQQHNNTTTNSQTPPLLYKTACTSSISISSRITAVSAEQCNTESRIHITILPYNDTPPPPHKLPMTQTCRHILAGERTPGGLSYPSKLAQVSA